MTTQNAEKKAIVSNYKCVTVQLGSKEKTVRLKESITAIAEQIQSSTSGVKTLAGSAFVHDGGHDRVRWLDSPTSLAAWLETQCRVRWTRSQVISGTDTDKVQPVSWAQLLDHLAETAPRYEAVEELPHWPARRSTYYLKGIDHYDVDNASGKTLNAFVDLLNPETDLDRQLLQAMTVTPMWGGEPGTVPSFLLTTQHGRGVGKSSTVHAIAKIYGGFFETKKGESVDKFEKRLGTEGSERERLILIDNIKGRTDHTRWESMITSPVIDAYRNYSGRVKMPNNKVWCLTLNTPDLSTDMASRSVVIEIGPKQHGVPFKSLVADFLDEHREALIADIIAFLKAVPKCKITTHDRWGEWQDAVLAKFDNGEELATLIDQRRRSVDSEATEAFDVAKVIERELRMKGLDPEADTVAIAMTDLLEPLSDLWGERSLSSRAAWPEIRPLLTTGPLSHCAEIETNRGMRLLWDRGGDRVYYRDVETDDHTFLGFAETSKAGADQQPASVATEDSNGSIDFASLSPEKQKAFMVDID